LSGFTKKQVKTLASKSKLPVKKDSESQEICFVSGKMNDFLKKHLKVKPGEIQDEKGRVLGEHSGLHFYTIGQRKGIGLSGGPYYVIEKDLKRNILKVSRNEKLLFKKELLVKDLNWISGKKPLLSSKFKVSIRYGQEPVPALLKPAGSRIRVVFRKPLRAMTSGQSAVFYRGQELSGGGIIC
jgi:tRNA-specific 2-thiouridylase